MHRGREQTNTTFSLLIKLHDGNNVPLENYKIGFKPSDGIFEYQGRPQVFVKNSLANQYDVNLEVLDFFGNSID